jgi:hypothetical protein
MEGERKASGDLKKAPAEPLAPAIMARARAAIAKIFGDAQHGSELGRLMFAGELTQTQGSAGFRIGEIYRRYHRHKHLRDAPKSPNYESGFGSSDLAEERMSAEQLERFEAEVTQATDAWKVIDKALAQVPRNVRQAVLDVCVFDTSVNPALYPSLRAVLNDAARAHGKHGEYAPKRHDANSLRRLLTVHSRGPTDGADHMAPTEVPRRKIDSATHAFVVVIRKLCPHLDQMGLDQAQEVFTAVRDRTDFERKRDRSP